MVGLDRQDAGRRGQVVLVPDQWRRAAVGGGQLEEGMAILTKPFEITVLARKVRAMTGS